MDNLVLIAAAAGGIVLVMILVGLGVLRWSSFNSRVDRRSVRRHQFEASWGEIIGEAERRAQAEKRNPRAGRRDGP